MKFKLNENQIPQVDDQTMRIAEQSYKNCLGSINQLKNYIVEFVSSLDVSDSNFNIYHEVSRQISTAHELLYKFQAAYSALHNLYLEYANLQEFKDPGDLKSFQRSLNSFEIRLDNVNKDLAPFIKTTDLDIQYSDDDWSEFQ